MWERFRTVLREARTSRLFAPAFGRSLSRENHHVRIPRRRERRHGRAQEGLHAGRPAAMGLYDQLRPVDNQERGSAQFHGQGPLWHLGGCRPRATLRPGCEARSSDTWGRMPLEDYCHPVLGLTGSLVLRVAEQLVGVSKSKRSCGSEPTSAVIFGTTNLCRCARLGNGYGLAQLRPVTQHSIGG